MDTIIVAIDNLSCPFCQKIYSNIKMLHRHMKIHYFAHYCSVCGAKFTESGNAVRHFKEVHNNVNRITCVCGRRFKRRAHYIAHHGSRTCHIPHTAAVLPLTTVSTTVQ